MNTQIKKSTQIFQGILTGIGLWIFGHLLSGRLAFVENMELYPTGPLVILFPFVFIAACILVAKYSVKTGNDVYYKASIISFVVPVLCWIIFLLLNIITEVKVPVLSSVAEIVLVVFIFPCVPVFSIFWQFLTVIGSNAVGIKMVLPGIVYFLPMLIGMLISIKIYKDN